MARLGVDYETVKQTAVKLLSQGMAPSVQKIREVLGTGSNTTIAEHLKAWREEYAKKTIHHLPANMPKELISTFEVLWQTAMEQAQNQLAEYKKVVDGQCETALQMQRDAEQTVVNLKQKLIELSVTLEQEVANKQKLNVELAVTNERMIKQDEAFIIQKNQYEDRIKRIYEEKDILITQYHQLQLEIKILQEQLTSQSEKQHNMLAQQYAQHEQSENRWLKLIDQAKQELIDTRKKSEKMLTSNAAQIKNLSDQLSDSQRIIYDKTAQLNLALDQLEQIRKEVKILDVENNKAKATLINLKGKHLSQPKKQQKKNSTLNQ